jgi:hypothetical protein
MMSPFRAPPEQGDAESRHTAVRITAMMGSAMALWATLVLPALRLGERNVFPGSYRK